jgi:N-acylneuraminate cytidylyltransferase
MSAVAIITARGGSKRIPRKNIRAFCGQPIMAYSIRAALDSGCFDEVMVSTDDAETAEIGRAHGATVPFLRSAAASDDRATTAAALVEVIKEYSRRNRRFELACCLYPTAPFVTPQLLQQGLQLLEADPTLASVVPITRFSHAIQRALRVISGRVSPVHPEHLATRSQDLEPAYHDAGQFYWIRVADFLAAPGLITSRTAPLELPSWQVQDIDTEDDWTVAEAKYSLHNRLTQTFSPCEKPEARLPQR